ncbi:hypothetical protein F0A16_20465 [Salinicola corii]|uniref:Uncharacterized protein n=1 Tax=Salinicola corii TaxID=2606937 RepID=A0A640W8X9_9GAMM|nr:hypothetical protein [Salinicola corii]KAA0015466.1 hypothetical protein F0A16_20465 [Salinicola corii]
MGNVERRYGSNPLVRESSRDTLAEIRHQIAYQELSEDRDHPGYAQGLRMVYDAIPVLVQQVADEVGAEQNLLSQNVSK